MIQLPPKSVAMGIFGNPKLRALYEGAEALTTKVGTQAFAVQIPSFAKEGTVAVFDDVVDVSGKVSLAAALKIHAASQTLKELYGTGAEVKAPTGKSFADVSLTIGGGVGAQGSAASGPLKISAKGSLSTGIDYRHVLPIQRDWTRLRALSDLLKTTRPPQLVELSKGGLADGEVHRLEATLNLDFNLDLKVGRSFALEKSVKLFDGLPAADLKAHGEMAITASLGLSLYERMYLAVGRSDGWARVRLQRENERRIGFSAMMALQAEYDLGGGLATVLEQALGQTPVPLLMSSVRAVVDPVAAGNWDAIKGRLTGKLADGVTELVNDTGWREWAAGSKEVAKLLKTSKEIVDFYDQIDPKVQSLWDQLLGKTDLGKGSKVRTLLAELTKVGDNSLPIDDLLDSSTPAGELVDLIETFSGKSLEEILLSSDGEIRKVLRQVAALAAKAEKLFALDTAVVGKIRGFTERTGIAGTVGFLRQATTNPKKLEEKISGRIRGLIERLAGKAWDQIGAGDLAKVQKWAQRTHDLLGGAEDLQAAILKKIRDVRGEVGFSVGLEIARVSGSTALLDVDIDLEREPDFRKAVEQALTSARVRELLNALAQRADDDKEGALPFRLRECVFTSRRVRTSSISFMLSFLGPLGKFIEKQQGISRRIEESSLRVNQVGKQLRRTATYSGGFQRTEIWNKTTSDSALWLEIQASDSSNMGRLEARFGKEDSRSLRATYTRDDSETTADELEAMASQLQKLGLTGGAGLDDVPPRVQTRLSIDIRLPGSAMSSFCAALQDEPEWDRYYLLAASRWFGDQLVDKRFDRKHGLGEVLTVFLRTDKFVGNWKKGAKGFGKSLSKGRKGLEFRIPMRKGDVRVQPISRRANTGQAFFDPDFDPIAAVISKRGRGFDRIGKLGDALASAGRSRTPAAYEQATRAFADGWKAATACSSSWPTPTFGMWLMMARLSEPDMRQVLAKSTGVAMLRWKAGEAWQGPVAWRVSPRGVKAPPLLF